jgi:PEP-CTERM motif
MHRTVHPALRHPPAQRRRSRLLPAAGLLALAAAATGPAHAAPTGVYNEYFVTGRAATGSGSGSDNWYQCNVGAAGALPGCEGYAGAGLAYLANTTTGTVDTTGRTRSFFADTTRRMYRGGYAELGEPEVVLLPGSSRARASADLADASLRASVVNNSENATYIGGQAQADLHDIVTLRVAGADDSTRTRVNFSFTVDGLAYDSGQTTSFGQLGSGSMQASLLLNDLSSANDNGDYTVIAVAGWSKTSASVFVQAPTFYENRGDAALAGGSWVQNSLHLMQFDGWLDIVGTSATINPTLSLSVACDVGLVCDYGNTARFSFVGLPSSVSYSSDSGVFLTAVPEPGSWALMLAGLLSVGAVARRRMG